jgi:hypothetical protein
MKTCIILGVLLIFFGPWIEQIGKGVSYLMILGLLLTSIGLVLSIDSLRKAKNQNHQPEKITHADEHEPFTK